MPHAKHPNDGKECTVIIQLQTLRVAENSNLSVGSPVAVFQMQKLTQERDSLARQTVTQLQVEEQSGHMSQVSVARRPGSWPHHSDCSIAN